MGRGAEAVQSSATKQQRYRLRLKNVWRSPEELRKLQHPHLEKPFLYFSRGLLPTSSRRLMSDIKFRGNGLKGTLPIYNWTRLPRGTLRASKEFVKKNALAVGSIGTLPVSDTSSTGASTTTTFTKLRLKEYGCFPKDQDRCEFSRTKKKPSISLTPRSH